MCNLMREHRIKVADPESEENLRVVLDGYGGLNEDLYAKLYQLAPSFDTPAWYIKHFALSEVQDRKILMHLYPGNVSVHDNAVGVQEWFEPNVCQTPFEMAERVTRSYLKSIEEVKNYQAEAKKVSAISWTQLSK